MLACLSIPLVLARAGFLSFLSAQHEYSGVLQLQFNDLALQAFGLITTQVAGADGYSLLALVDANFLSAFSWAGASR